MFLRAGHRQRILESHPPQQRTLDPRRVLRDTGERDAVPDHILVARDRAARRDHLGERGDRLHGVSDAAPDDLVGEHRSRRLADRTALTVVGDVGHLLSVVGQRDPQRHLVAAGGIHLKRLALIRLAQPSMVGMLVVIEDHFLIQLVQSHGHSLPKNSAAWRTPATRRSTSSSVLYTANDARAVAAIPNRRCSGHAQWWPTRTATPSSSRTWPTSCAWTPSRTNDTGDPRPTRAVGPTIRTPGTFASPSSAAATSAASCASTASMPISDRYR